MGEEMEKVLDIINMEEYYLKVNIFMEKYGILNTMI